MVEITKVERLGDVPESAVAECLGGHRHLLVGRDHDDRDRVVDLLDVLQHLDPVHARHVDVEHDDVRTRPQDRAEGVGAVERGVDVVVALEVLGEDLEDERLVVHEEKPPACAIDHLTTLGEGRAGGQARRQSAWSAGVLSATNSSSSDCRTGWTLTWDVRRSQIEVQEGPNGAKWTHKVGELPPNVQEIIAKGGLEKWVKNAIEA